MQFDDFITRVQEQARLNTREEAIALTRAVLETLGERLDRKVRNGIEAQLPNDLKEFLLAREGQGDQYSLEEFYNRIGARADLNYADATARTREVIGSCRSAVTVISVKSTCIPRKVSSSPMRRSRTSAT